MCLQYIPQGTVPEILKARRKELAERHWKLLDEVLKAIPKNEPRK